MIDSIKQLINIFKNKMLSWLVMTTIYILAMKTRNTMIILFALISFLGIREFCSITSVRNRGNSVVRILYFLGIIQYYLVYINWYNFFIVFIPVYTFVIISILLILTQNAENFLKQTSIIYLGAMISIFSISHFAYFVNLKLDVNSITLVKIIIYLTQANVMYQHICGKTFGKHNMIPKINPTKTFEGFFGGMILTTVTGVLLGKYFLTTLPIIYLIFIGILISGLGFFGDAFIGAIKLDLNIKSTSKLIPGYGGILDRINNIIFVGPITFHLVRFFLT